jgi:acyl-CoA thioester hydrolase
MPRIFVHAFTVPADAIDALGHVNNLEYLRWMQDVATAHSTAQGWPLERYLKLGAGWFVRSHTIEYRRPAFAGEAISLVTWVAGFNRSSSRRKYLFFRSSDRQVVAKAETLWAFVNFRAGAPARIIEELRSAFEVVPDEGEALHAARDGTPESRPVGARDGKR